MKNKRILTKLLNKSFGTVLFVEIGATYVGTIHQTFIPYEHYAKGDEKGYFSLAWIKKSQERGSFLQNIHSTF